jgi:hypothetical protein
MSHVTCDHRHVWKVAYVDLGNITCRNGVMFEGATLARDTTQHGRKVQRSTRLANVVRWLGRVEQACRTGMICTTTAATLS